MVKRNLSLKSRAENTREAKPIEIPKKFSLEEIKKHFDESLQSIKNQYNVAELLEKEGKNEDCENIRRMQIVLLEGVLDFYLHEISKYALYQMFLGNWNKSNKYLHMKMPMEQVEIGMRANESTEWFFAFVDNSISCDVYLSAENMKDQLNLIGLPFCEVMQRAFIVTDKKIKNKQKEAMNQGKIFIQNLFQRRNKIVHQVDREHKDAEKNEITREYVESNIEQVVKIVEAIHSLAIESETLTKEEN